MSDTATIERAPKPVRHKKKRGFPSTYTILAGSPSRCGWRPS